MSGRPSSAFMLPQALIAQYPALQALNWDQMATNAATAAAAAAAAAASRQEDGSHTPYDASSAGELSYTEDDGYLSSSSQIQTSTFHTPSPLSAVASTGDRQALAIPRSRSALSADAMWQQNIDMSWVGGGGGGGGAAEIMSHFQALNRRKVSRFLPGN
ncbi:hypothetical protein KEM54_006518 [Ascosphaera aggregata]|nr:hypothetical protein KEM54_006518 [Ascosphaera aggregata]